MDIQRTGLIVILALITYALILRWNDFTTDAAQQPVATLNAQPAPGSSSSETTVTDLPSGANTTMTSSSTLDLTSSAKNSRGLLRIETPKQILTIDLHGGDIVELQLPLYPQAVDQPDSPLPLLESVNRTYVAQSGLVGPDGPDASDAGRPLYSASADLFQVMDTVTDVVLTAETDKVKVEKVYTVDPDTYAITVSHRMTNLTDQPIVVSPFTQLKRDDSTDPSQQSSMGMQAFLGFAIRTTEERYRKISFSDFDSQQAARELNADLKAVAMQGGHLALLQHYFTTAWIPNPEQMHTFSFRRNTAGHNIGSVISPDITINPGATATTSALFYAGPKDQDALELLSPGLELVVDYGWLWFIAQPLFWLLKFIQSYVGNWGLAIVLVTILVKGAFFQLSAAAYRSMAKMRKFTPEISRLRELYGDDKQRMSKEMMDLYKREKINPLGGCLPILVQMPVFLALYWVLMESVELRQAPLFLWIDDLSVKDPLFVLPLLMGVSMYIQQSLNPTPPDPMQAKIMKYMPVAFTFFFLWFPAGLVLYWVVNNVLSIAQQWVITRAIEKTHPAT
jgi:YidC/Oxa1 family membrane protein insertase